MELSYINKKFVPGLRMHLHSIIVAVRHVASTCTALLLLFLAMLSVAKTFAACHACPSPTSRANRSVFFYGTLARSIVVDGCGSFVVTYVHH